jgi:hypothetical protein
MRQRVSHAIGRLLLADLSGPHSRAGCLRAQRAGFAHLLQCATYIMYCMLYISSFLAYLPSCALPLLLLLLPWLESEQARRPTCSTNNRIAGVLASGLLGTSTVTCKASG